MNQSKNLERESVKTTSDVSVMRIAFLYSVKVTGFCTIATVVASIVGPFIAFLIDHNLSYKLDLVGIASIIGVVSVASFGGKVGQSAFEANTPSQDTGTTPTTLVKEAGVGSLDNPNA